MVVSAALRGYNARSSTISEMTQEPLAPTGSATPKLRVRIAHRSDVGKVRSENQDFAVVAEEQQPDSKGSLLIVADGMGGHRGGATASRVASTTLRDEYLASAESDPAAALRAAVEEANRKIFAESQSNASLRGMGTTCSAVLIHKDQAWFAHVGDSRIYLVRNGDIQQLTDDHSLVASMVREGLLTRAEAEVHPRRNVLQRSLGVSDSVEVDVSPPLGLQPGDTFIICSDGLHGVVKEPELREVATLPIQQAATEYIRRAIDRGAPDNVTVIVARVEDASDSAAEPSATNATTQELDPEIVRNASSARSQPAGGSSAVKWILLALLIFGALGASFFVWGSRFGDSRAASAPR